MVLYNALALPRAARRHDPCTCAHGVYGKFICARRRASEERSVLIVREYRATADNNTASLVATLPTGAHSAQGKFVRARRQASEARSVLIVREYQATAGNNAASLVATLICAPARLVSLRHMTADPPAARLLAGCRPAWRILTSAMRSCRSSAYTSSRFRKDTDRSCLL